MGTRSSGSFAVAANYQPTQQSNEQKGRRDASRRTGHYGDRPVLSGTGQCFDTNRVIRQGIRAPRQHAHRGRIPAASSSRQHRRDRHRNQVTVVVLVSGSGRHQFYAHTHIIMRLTPRIFTIFLLCTRELGACARQGSPIF